MAWWMGRRSLCLLLSKKSPSSLRFNQGLCQLLNGSCHRGFRTTPPHLHTESDGPVQLGQPLGPPGDRNVHIFDRLLKSKQRDRAAFLSSERGDPLLREVTERLLDRLEDTTYKFHTVLNLGGAVENVRKQLGNRGDVRKLIQMDASADMIERSRRAALAEEGMSPPREYDFVVGDEEAILDVIKEGELDAVISCLGLHWVNDLPSAMSQCRAALKPDGLFLAAMYGGETLRELRIACSVAEIEREGGISPRISPFAQVRDAGNLLGRAGLALPMVDVDEITIQYPSALELVEHLRMMGDGNAVRNRRPILRRDSALAAAAAYQSTFGDDDGSVPATFQIIYMTGWSPDRKQQRPKQRGSATVSFHDLQTAVQKDTQAKQDTNTETITDENEKDDEPQGSSSEEGKEERKQSVEETRKGDSNSNSRVEKRLPSGTWWTLE